MIEIVEMIRARAYEIWQAEGQPEGRALEHWCRAEAEAVAPSARKPAKKARRTKQ
jgi:Protein of unknown function (DUF2934)